MDKLFDKYGVAVVGFDVVFAEKDESSGLKVLQKLGRDQLKDDPKFQTTLAQIRPQLEYDNLFAEKIKNRNVVLGYYLTEKKGSISGMLPEPAFQVGSFKGRPIAFTTYYGYGANLPELQQAAARAGHFNPAVDPDGMVRRVPMLANTTAHIMNPCRSRWCAPYSDPQNCYPVLPKATQRVRRPGMAGTGYGDRPIKNTRGS